MVVFIVIPDKGMLLILGLSLREDIMLGQSWDKGLKSFSRERYIEYKAGVSLPARTSPLKSTLSPVLQ